MGGAASAQSGSSELEQMVACTFLLGQALTRAFPEIYTLNDFHANKKKLMKEMEKEHQEAMKKMAKESIPMVFLKPDGTVTPVRFVDKEGNPVEEEAAALCDKEEKSNNNEEAEAEEEDDADADAVPLDECLVFDFQNRKVPIKITSIAETNEDGWNVLHAACHQKATFEAAKGIIQCFKENNHDLDMKTKRGPGSYASGWTPLQMACAYGITETVKELVEAGAQVNVSNSTGWMPLHEAVHRGFVEITTILLEAGAATDTLIPSSMIAPYHPQYPLAHACRQGHLKVVEALLKAGADVDAQNEGGWTGLHESVFFRHEQVVRALLEHGANVDMKTSQNYTVLDFELTSGIKEALLEFGDLKFIERANKKWNGDADKESEEDAKNDNKGKCTDEEKQKEKPTYRLLGDLPEFGSNSFMHNATSTAQVDDDDDDNDPVKQEERRKRIEERKKLREEKKKKKKKTKTKTITIAPAEPGIPKEYACGITGKLLVNPVTTFYGHHFEHQALLAWIKSQGNVCPITGQPLSESDCIIDKDLRIEISDWQLKKAINGGEDGSSQVANKNISGLSASVDDKVDGDDDNLYEF